MTTMLLAKNNLEPDFIDTAVGEAHVVREALLKNFGFLHVSNEVLLCQNGKCEYLAPNGYKPLVKFLEDKHGAPVVITNGAKQALGAVFHTLNYWKKRRLGLRTPHWSLLEPLALAHNLSIATKDYDAYLAVLPSNPDGFHMENSYAQYLYKWHKELDIPFIHDAVYYNPIYAPKQRSFPRLGDVQLFSMSKSYGLSAMRIGYAVCYDERFYHPMLEYVEMMTVGVSIASQDICYNLLTDIKNNPDRYSSFVRDAQTSLFANKSIAKTIRPDVLEVPQDLEHTPGMFLFCKARDVSVFQKAKVHVADGRYFGADGHYRMNLALPTGTLIEVVERLNSVSLT